MAEPPSDGSGVTALVRRLDAQVAAAVAGTDVVVSGCLATRDRTVWSVSADVAHYAASTMKLPVLLAAYRRRDAGTLDLDQPVRVHDRFPSRAGGDFAVDPADDSDAEVWDALGTEVGLGWLARRMIVRSSNLATNLVLEVVGLDAVAEAVAVGGGHGVQVDRGIGDFAAQHQGTSNLVTAAGLTALLLALAEGTAARPGTCAEVLEVLAANEVGTDVAQGLPPGTWVAHKNGWVTGTVHDAALVRPGDAAAFVLTVCTTATGATLWQNDHAHAVIGELATTVWDARSALA